MTRWLELEDREQRAKLQVLLNHNAELQCALADAQGTVDAIAAIDGEFTLVEAAKHLQVPPRSLTKWLADSRWIYKRGASSRYYANQTKLATGVLAHRQRTYISATGTHTCLKDRLYVTSKGLTYLASQVNYIRRAN